MFVVNCYNWPFEGNDNADTALSENEFDTPVVHCITELLSAFEANTAYPEVFKMSTIIVFRAKDRAYVNLSLFPNFLMFILPYRV